MDHWITRAAVRRLVIIGALLGASTAPAQTWTFVGGPEGGSLAALDTSTGETLAATSAGIFRSTDGGAAWLLIGEDVGFAQVRTVVRAGEAVLVGTLDGPVLRMTNDGATWDSLAQPAGTAQVVEMAAAAGVVYAIASTSDSFRASTGAVFMSSDSGTSWTIGAGAPSDASWLFVDGGAVLAGTWAGVHRSTDGGVTWTLMLSADVLPDLTVFGRPVRLGSALYLPSFGLFTPTQVWRLADDGTSIQPVATGIPTNERVLNWTALDGTIVAITDGGSAQPRLWRSSESGPWTVIHPHPVGVAVADDRIVLGSTGGAILLGTPSAAVNGVLRSLDGGATFSPSNTGLVGARASVVAEAAEGLLAISAQHQELWRRTTGGQWLRADLGVTGARVLAVKGVSAGVALAGTDGSGIFRSLDGGATWAASNAGVPMYNGTAGLQFREISNFAVVGGTIFAGTGWGTEFAGTGSQHGAIITTGGGVLRSVDGGESWMRVNAGIPVAGTNRAGEPVYPPVMAMGEIGGTVLAATLTGFFRTIDMGASWQAAGAGIPEAYEVMSLEQHGGLLFAAARDDGIFVSDDSGATFAPVIGTGLPDRPVLSLASDGDTLYAALGEAFGAPPLTDADVGVYASADGGASWLPAGDAPRAATSVTVAEGLVFAAAGLGVWQAGAGCAADLTADGATDVFDLLAYLDLWFVEDAAAERTGDSVVDVFDLLSYLDEWFEGC